MNSEQARNTIINETRYFLSLGYSKEKIIAKLEQQGFPKDYCIKVVDYIYAQQQLHHSAYQNNEVIKVEHTHKPSSSLVFLVLGLLIIFFVSFFLIFSGSKEQTVLLDYEATLTSQTFFLGEKLSFETRYSNQGTSKSQDVFVTYRVIDQNQNIVLEWSETKAIEHVARDVVSKELPTYLKEGRYYVYSEVSYGKDQLASSRTFFFELLSKESANENKVVEDSHEEEVKQEQNQEEIEPIAEEDNEPNILPDQNPSGGTSEKNEEHDAILHIITEAESFSRTDTGQAATLCLSLEEQTLIDGCYQQLAKTSANYAYCDEIRDFTTKDYCYLQYIIATKDYEKCSFISSEKTKQTCDQLNS